MAATTNPLSSRATIPAPILLVSLLIDALLWSFPPYTCTMACYMEYCWTVFSLQICRTFEAGQMHDIPVLPVIKKKSPPKTTEFQRNQICLATPATNCNSSTFNFPANFSRITGNPSSSLGHFWIDLQHSDHTSFADSQLQIIYGLLFQFHYCIMGTENLL